MSKKQLTASEVRAKKLALLAMATFAKKSEVAALIPSDMQVSYPDHITMGHEEGKFIDVQLTPKSAPFTVLFLYDLNGPVAVSPDGKLQAKKAGTSTIHIVPSFNTAIAKSVQITVEEPAVTLMNDNSVFLASDGSFMFT